MDTQADKKLARTRLLMFILALIVGSTVAMLAFGNPITWLLDRWSDLVPDQSLSVSPITLPGVLNRDSWRDLALHGQIPITASTTGRSNPFVSSGSSEVPKPEDRDARRVSDIKAIRDALRAHKVAYGQYPDGSNVVIGSSEAACLTDKGWQQRSVCVFDVGVVPMPADPGDGVYTYSITSDGYQVAFTLEEKIGDLSAGDHLLTPMNIE